MAVNQRLWIVDLSALLQPLSEDGSGSWVSDPYRLASLSLPFRNTPVPTASGKYERSALKKNLVLFGQLIRPALESWVKDVRATKGNEGFSEDSVRLEVTTEGTDADAVVATFVGAAALVIRAVGRLIEHHGDKLDTDRLPEAVRNPRRVIERDFPPPFDAASFPEGASYVLRDTCYDNCDKPVVVVPGNFWLPLAPAMYGREWGCSLGAGKPVITNDCFKGDLYEAAFCAGSKGRGRLIGALRIVSAACQLPVLMPPALAGAGTAAAAAGVESAPPERMLLGDTGPLLLISHMGAWTSKDKSRMGKMLHYHWGMETALALRAHFQRDKALCGKTPGEADLPMSDLSTAVFFAKTEATRQHLRNNAPLDGSHLVVGPHGVETASGYHPADIMKCRAMEAGKLIKVELQAAVEEAYKSVVSDIENLGDEARALLEDLPPLEELSFRFLLSHSQARIALWVGRKHSADGSPALNEGIPQPWRVYLAQNCLLHLYRQLCPQPGGKPDGRAQANGHIAVRTGSRYDAGSGYFAGLRDVLDAADPAWGPPMGLLQLPPHTYLKILRGFAAGADTSLLMPGTVVPDAAVWLEAHDADGSRIIT